MAKSLIFEFAIFEPTRDYLNVKFAFLGPFKVNGVPLRRVNQSYVIATSTKVDIAGVNVEKFDDKYFSKEVKMKKKKGEGEFFEAEKEVRNCFYDDCFFKYFNFCHFLVLISGHHCFTCRKKAHSHRTKRMIKRPWTQLCSSRSRLFQI